MSYAQIIDQTSEDLLVMETIAVPLSFLLLVWVSVDCSRRCCHWRSACSRSLARWLCCGRSRSPTEVSVFALNLTPRSDSRWPSTTRLLIVSRFRDEVAAGAGREEAQRHGWPPPAVPCCSGGSGRLSMFVIVLSRCPSRSRSPIGSSRWSFAAVAALVVTPGRSCCSASGLTHSMYAASSVGCSAAPTVARPVEQTISYRWTKPL